MSPIFHLPGEDVAGIALACNMEDVDAAILNSFAGAVVTEFQMAHILHGGSVGPVDSGFVVIVDERRCGVINKGNASHIKTISQVADCCSNLGAFAGGTDFGFTQAERCLLLADGFP